MVTFTRTTMTSDETTGVVTPSVTTITGGAMQVSGEPAHYRELGLVEAQAPTLLFTPTSYNIRAWSEDFVRVGDTVEWAGAVFTVKAVYTTAPDGFVVISRIIVGR